MNEQANEIFNYVASISYEGSDFAGFQIQNKDRTIQGEIEKVLYRLNQDKIQCLLSLKDRNKQEENDIKINKLSRIGFAGRTDSKVHAIENVISFSLIKDFEPEKVIKIFNSNLPDSIRFYKCKRTEKRINPRYDAIERVYLYVIYKGKLFIPFLLNKAFIYNEKFDTVKFEKALKIFEGRHNFRFFTTSLEKRSPIRTVYQTKVLEINDFILIFIRGNSFLHKQVRFMLGSAFMCSLNKIDIDFLKNMLDFDETNIKNNLTKIPSIFVLPPQGLYLAKVRFEEDEPIDFDDIIKYFKIFFN
ncbi:MAG TPA: tRNA pseudouridine(38-40) synthase TruA [Exilispira sp.]|nr:tRNA pseudouridine(38-40) synthase TruA [Exilispira sp.]